MCDRILPGKRVCACWDAKLTASVVDEGWLQEWCEFGHRELADYLDKQAAFGQYLEARGMA